MQRRPEMMFLAWTGIVTMHRADWNDEAGSTVTFKLPMQTTAGDLSDHRNPFHKWTKRRKGKAGTRFFMAVSTSESQPKTIYSDQVMLAGWNDSQSTGWTVKFWIANDDMGHPFEGISRKQELALALSELDEDDQPIDQKLRDKVESIEKRPSERLSFAAAMLCKNPDFWAWAKCGDSEEQAKNWMYAVCGISSRAELDTDETAAGHFHNAVRKPFAATQEAPF